MNDERLTKPGDPDPWPADFRAAELATLQASLDATPAQRLEWLEEALKLAWEAGALRRS